MELHVNELVFAEKLGKDSVFVEAEKVGEVFLELGVGQQVQAFVVEAAVSEAIHREHVADVHRALEPEVDVEAHHEVPPERDDVARDAVVGGGDAVGGLELERDRAEHVLAGVVQLPEAGSQVIGVLIQAATDDLVGALVQGVGLGFGLFGGFGHGYLRQRFALSRRPRRHGGHGERHQGRLVSGISRRAAFADSREERAVRSEGFPPWPPCLRGLRDWLEDDGNGLAQICQPLLVVAGGLGQ